jgi:beta-galactosidase
MRRVINWNAGWLFAKHPEKKDFLPVTLPHTWNAEDGQDGGNDYFRGQCLYVKKFAMPDHQENERAILEINGAAYISEVRLNGHLLGHHENGFSTWRVDLSDDLKEENLLEISCDNRENDHVYPQTADFTFYGGLYRDVNLILVSKAHFSLLKDGGKGLYVTPEVHEDQALIRLRAEVSEGDSVVFHTNGSETEAEVKEGAACAEVTIDHPHLWNGCKDPYLYECRAELKKEGRITDTVSVHYGIRTAAIDPKKGFLLNGKSYPLRGVSRHQDRKGKGNAISHTDMEEDMCFLQEIGANVVRLAHYQHDQYFYDLCDEKGICVWAEIPYISRHMPAGNANTQTMLKELIIQSYNHPSIVVWGLSNEITAGSPVDEDMLENHRKLNALCHRMDPSRPTSMASVFMLETDSPLNRIPDVNAYNLYFGWYLGSLDQNEKFFDEWHEKYPDRAIGFTEYGADANPAYHSSVPSAGDYSEEYQFVYHHHMLEMLAQRPWIWISAVWNLFDFAADGRNEGGKHGENQKGLVTFDRKIRKDAFYLYKAYWSEEPFVHLCGKRCVHRTGEKTMITVCSNQPEVSLSINGKPFETKPGSHVFHFEVPLEKTMEITVQSGTSQDDMKIEQWDHEDASYRKEGKEVHNWLSSIDYDPSCYSIQDTLGELAENEKTGALLKQVVAKAAASRGDVAKRTTGNANLMKMMAGMKLADLLKKAGTEAVSEAEVRKLNALLQKIRK